VRLAKTATEVRKPRLGTRTLRRAPTRSPGYSDGRDPGDAEGRAGATGFVR
jgi:hypothetical protein